MAAILPSSDAQESPFFKAVNDYPSGTLHVALLFANFGFYHLARLKALREKYDILPIEFANEQRLYGWQTEKHSAGIKTLYSGALEDMSTVDRVKSCSALWRLLNDSKASHLFIPGYADVRCLIAALWARTHRSRSVLMFESTEHDKPRTQIKEFAKALLVRLLFSEAFVGGYSSSQYLQKLGVPEEKIVTKYDVIDNEFFGRGTVCCRASSSASEWSLPSNYFLFVGRLAREKNCTGLLNAFRKYKDLGGTWDLVMVGRGPLQKELFALRSSLDLDAAVHLAGFKNGHELFPYYAFARCFVLPSISEPWGLVVNEAMASGLPVLVSSACGCAPDLVRSDINGYCFRPDQLADLARLFIRVSELPLAVTQEMGSASQRIISNYSPATWIESTAKLIRIGSGDST